MRQLSSLEKKAEVKLAKRIKPKTHFSLKEILRLMEQHRMNCNHLDDMEKVEFISLINNNFKFDDKVILERIFQAFDGEKVLIFNIIYKWLSISKFNFQDGVISREEYVMGLSIFLFGTEKEQIRYFGYCYRDIISLLSVEILLQCL